MYFGVKRVFFVTDFIAMIGENLKLLRVRDVLDVLIVAYLIYMGVKLVRETRAFQLIKGIVVIVVAAQVSGWLDLNVLNTILVYAMEVGVLALLVVFQPELRSMLEKVGRTSFKNLFTQEMGNIEDTIEEVVSSCGYMASQKIGALIVMENTTKLADIGATGTKLDSLVSSGLLINIFIPNTPLHDGAVLIGDGKIKSAACFLPLTKNNDLSKELGTRHRAAIGMSEVADCMVVVVSEETGKISVAANGSLTRNLNMDSLRKILKKGLIRTPDTITNIKKEKLGWAVKKK